jgi:hypothetical protein
MRALRAAPLWTLFLSLIWLAGVASSAPKGGKWVYLGSSHVDGRADHDKIKVGNGEGSFQALRLRVEGTAVKFDHIIVRYENGQEQQVAANFVVHGNSDSPRIDLAGSYRNIKYVELWYERGNWGGQNPKVSLYGIR